MEDTATKDDPNTNPQLTEYFFVESEYVFLLDSMNQIYHNIISTALKNTKAYESYLHKNNHFILTFHFPAPKERDLHCSHENMLHIKLPHTYSYYKFIQHHYITNEVHSTDLHFLTPNAHHHTF